MKTINELLQHPDISFTESPNTISVTNPATQEIIAYVKKTDANQLNNIINRAQTAQKIGQVAPL